MADNKNTSSNSRFSCDCTVIHQDLVDRVRAVMPDQQIYYDLAELFKLFADKTRAQILWALSHQEMCVCDLACLLDMTKSAISHQLKSLRLANLVKYRRLGKIVFYSLADNHVKDILAKGYEHVLE